MKKQATIQSVVSPTSENFNMANLEPSKKKNKFDGKLCPSAPEDIETLKNDYI